MHAYTQKHMRAHAYALPKPTGPEKNPQFVRISSELENESLAYSV